MATVLIATSHARSRTDVEYTVELRLERRDGEAVYCVDLIVEPPGKPRRSDVRVFGTKRLAVEDYDRFVSLNDAIIRQRIGATADGQIRLDL